MKALSYLVITQLKNRILSLKKKPAMMILYSVITIVFIASFVILLTSGNQLDLDKKYADERILFLILAGIGLFYMIIYVSSGLSTGSSLFTMPDVGLLFVSPISPKKILVYGLLSASGKALLASIFIFYQISTLRSSFGYGVREIITLVLIFVIMTIFCQLMSIGIYIYSNGNPKRKKIVKYISSLIVVILLLIFYLYQRQEYRGQLEALLQIVASKWFGYIPVVGWSTMLFIGVVERSLLQILIPLCLYLLFAILILYLLASGKADYYEDVLLSTEINYQTLKAAKEGISRPTNRKVRKNIVKSSGMGINRGSGAMTFFYKHLLEMKRKSQLVFIDSYSIFMIIAFAIAGYQFRVRNLSESFIYTALGASIYIQYIITVVSKLKIELSKPYIYLIPQKSIYKVIAASLTHVLKACVDGISIFVVFTIFSGINPITGVFFALAYTSSGIVFIGMTILFQRVLGGQPNKLAQIYLGLGLLVVIMAPAIGASVLAALLLPPSLSFITTLPYSLYCLLFTALILAISGNLIDQSEYTGRI